MSNTHSQLSVCTDDLRLDIKRALQAASALGFRAVDIGATAGPLDPRQMSKSAQRHLSRYLSDLGLRLGSLRGPVAGASYADGAAGERRLEMMRSIIAMAGEMRVPVVSTALGGFGGQSGSDATSRLIEAIETLANDSYRHGVQVAIETTGVSPEELRGLLSGLDCPTLGASCDSGAMLMEGNDPHRVAEFLAGRIHVVRARDATFGSSTAAGREVAMGEGALDIPAFLASLHEAGFSGDMIVSRPDSAHPNSELASAGKILAPYLMSS